MTGNKLINLLKVKDSLSIFIVQNVNALYNIYQSIQQALTFLAMLSYSENDFKGSL